MAYVEDRGHNGAGRNSATIVKCLVLTHRTWTHCLERARCVMRSYGAESRGEFFGGGDTENSIWPRQLLTHRLRVQSCAAVREKGSMKLRGSTDCVCGTGAE